MVRIVVADDHALVRDVLRRVIERERDMEIVGEAATGVSTVERVRALRPDVLLLDLTMPGGEGSPRSRRSRRPAKRRESWC